MLTISDSVALKIVNETFLIGGVGNEIRTFTESGGCTLPFKLKGKVHGIECVKPFTKILAYGENEFILFTQLETDFRLLYRGTLSDWISSGKVLNDAGTFVLLTAHSVALHLQYDSKTQSCEILEKVSCTDKSTLYCSYMYGNNWNQLLILGGNAFGELLVWQPSVKTTDTPAKAKLLQRKSAHNGVIFSIDVDMDAKLLVTTSDDRSIRFWEISIVETCDGSYDFERTIFNPLKSGYSHVARVFKGKLIREGEEIYAITGGEDSYICLWNKNSELLFKRRQQFGATIWNIDYHNATKTLYTAGSCGNILRYNLEGCFCRKSIMSVLQTETLVSDEYIAKIRYLNQDNFIGITNKNRLMHRNNLNHPDWLVVENFNSSKCTVLETCNDYVAVAGYQQVSLYEFCGNSMCLKLIYRGKLIEGLIRSFTFLSKEEFLISDELGNCKLVKVKNIECCLNINLPQCKERWITTACKVDDTYLVISNRQGSLILYSISDDGGSFELCDTIKCLHGRLGATTISTFKSVKSFSLIRTTGHDNTIKNVKIDKNTNTLSVLSRESIPLAWVEKVVVSQENDVELLFGFNDNHFVLWSRRFDTHFAVPCGGGHRCWDMNVQLTKNYVSMAFINNKQVLINQEPIFNKPAKLLNIPQNNWHVRPCNVVRTFQEQDHFIISGGDDNLLKISKYHSSSGTLTQLQEIYCHISNIRGIHVTKPTENGRLIFSCGGRAQICVTFFDIKTQMVEELVNYTIQKEKPSQSIRFDPETRNMSIDVQPATDGSFEMFVGCSDGYIRRLTMHTRPISKICLLAEMFYGKCVLHVRLAGGYLLTAGTDGVICFWQTDTLEIVFKLAHHESGINSFDVRVCNENEFHLLTGGDDQQVVYSTIHNHSDKFNIVALHHMDYLHTAQVTAVKFSPEMKYFYSTSVDQVVQKVYFHRFTSDFCIPTCIADTKGMDVVPADSSGKLLAFVYGCGLQVIDLCKK